MITVSPFDEVLKDLSAGNKRLKTDDYLTEGKIPIVDQGIDPIAGYTDDESARCDVDLPVIIFGDHTRHFKYVDFPFAIGADGVKVLRPKRKVDMKFLYYQCNGLDIPEAGYSRHFKFLRRKNLSLPPIDEQRRTAAILDQADALRRARRRAITRLNDLAQAIFYEMFGDARQGNAHYPVKLLGDLCSVIRDGTHKTPAYVESGIPFVTVKNIVSGSLDLSKTKFISAEEHSNLTRRVKPQRGDILVSKDGTIGVPCLIDTDADFSIFVSVALLRVEEDQIDQTFLVNQIASDTLQRQIKDNSKGIAIRHLHLQDFKRLQVIVPPIDIQKAFSHKIREISQHRNRYLRQLDTLDTLFASLQQRAFRGELQQKPLAA